MLQCGPPSDFDYGAKAAHHTSIWLSCIVNLYLVVYLGCTIARLRLVIEDFADGGDVGPPILVVSIHGALPLVPGYHLYSGGSPSRPSQLNGRINDQLKNTLSIATSAL